MFGGRAARVVLASAAIAAACLSVQARFDARSAEEAKAAVARVRGPGGRSLEELLAARHPGAFPRYEAKVESACLQHVRVRAEVPGRAYDFVVDLGASSVHPASPASEELLRRLMTPTESP